MKRGLHQKKQTMNQTRACTDEMGRQRSQVRFTPNSKLGLGSRRLWHTVRAGPCCRGRRQSAGMQALMALFAHVFHLNDGRLCDGNARFCVFLVEGVILRVISNRHRGCWP